MSTTVTAAPSATPETDVSADRFCVGTLRYTVAGLIWVFCWLLWGDFCYTVMEQVNWNILPLTLKQMNAPIWALPIVYTTIPGVINLVFNPVISTISDRHRGRWGRRIPFLVFSAPLISASLVAMAFCPEIAAWMHGWLGPIGGWSIVAISVFTLGLLVATFKIFDLFLNTAFWYLFNDVVPSAFMGRFQGLFRGVGCAGAMLFMHFVYPHSITHMRWIYLGAAAVYFFGFTLMCLFVKEGQYPPPVPIASSQKLLRRLVTTIREYAAECLTHRIYWLFFLHSMAWALANAIGCYQTNLNLSLGITLQQWGDLNTGLQFVMIILAPLSGFLVDRSHPVRLVWYMEIVMLLMTPLNFIWMYSGFTAESPHVFPVMIALQAINLPVGLLCSTAGIAMMMRLLPKDRFGQFCSFNAMCGAFMNIAGSMAVGLFMHCMQIQFSDERWGKDYCYRLMPAWQVPFVALGVFTMWLLFREWKRLGGAENYFPPAPLSKQIDP